MTLKNFTCENCKETFKKNWSDAEAEKEYASAPWNIPGELRGVVCDDCFKEFKVWFDGLTPEQHVLIRASNLE